MTALGIVGALLVNGLAAHTLQVQLEGAPLLIASPTAPPRPSLPSIQPIIGIEVSPSESPEAIAIASDEKSSNDRHHKIHVPPQPAPAAAIVAPPAIKAQQSRRQPTPSSARSAQSAVRTFSIDRQAIKDRFKKASDVFGHGRYLPYQRAGVRRGLQFVDIAPGGIFAQLGFQTGDVVLSVNGVALNTQQDVLANFEKMRKMHTLNLALERRGELLNFHYILK